MCMVLGHEECSFSSEAQGVHGEEMDRILRRVEVSLRQVGAQGAKRYAVTRRFSLEANIGA